MKWGIELKRFRSARGLTQAALADIMNIEQATVSRWERGVHEPELGAQQSLRKLMFGGGIKPDSLILQNANNSPFAVKVANCDGKNLAASAKAAALHGIPREQLATADYRPYFTDGLLKHWDRATAMGFFEGELASVVVYNKWIPLQGSEPKYCISYWTPARLADGEIVLISEFQLIGQHEHDCLRADVRFVARTLDQYA